MQSYDEATEQDDTIESGEETSGVDAPSEHGEQPPAPPDESADAVPDDATEPGAERSDDA